MAVSLQEGGCEISQVATELGHVEVTGDLDEGGSVTW